MVCTNFAQYMASTVVNVHRGNRHNCRNCVIVSFFADLALRDKNHVSFSCLQVSCKCTIVIIEIIIVIEFLHYTITITLLHLYIEKDYTRYFTSGTQKLSQHVLLASSFHPAASQ